MRARALRSLVLLGLLAGQTGRCAPLAHGSSAASYSSPKNNYFQKQIASLLAQTRVYLSAGLSCTLLSYIASYWAALHPAPELHWTLISYTKKLQRCWLLYWMRTAQGRRINCEQTNNCDLLSYATPSKLFGTLKNTFTFPPPPPTAHQSQLRCYFWRILYRKKYNVLCHHSCADPYG